MIKLENVAQSLNMTYSKKDNVAYGEINGIMFTMSPTEYPTLITLETGINIDATGRRADIAIEITEKAKQFKKSVTNVVVSAYSIKAQVNIANVARIELMNEFCAYIKTVIDEYGLKPCCAACGESKPTSFYCVGDNTKPLCDVCSATILTNIQEGEVENSSKKGSVLAGVIGALLGALIGGILWVIVLQLGYIAGIVGIVTIICAHKGYTMFSGKKDVKAAIVAVIVSIAVIFGAHMVGCSIEVFKLLQENGATPTYFEALSATPAMVFDPEIIISFMRDLIIGYIFMAVGAYRFIKSAIQNPTGKLKFNRVSESNETTTMQ